MPNRAEIRFRAKTIVTSLPRDIYSDRPKNDTIIKFSLNVIEMASSFDNTDRFIRDSKMKVVTIKRLGWATLIKLPIAVIQKFCFYGNLTSHFSSLLWQAKRAASEHANERIFLCPSLLASSPRFFRVRLSREFSRLPQMERLLAGLTYTCVWFNMLVQLCFY